MKPAEIVARIPAAQAALRGVVYRTPLEYEPWLGARLKLECYQPTGSFKVRGALAALSALSTEERERGVVTASAGNHGLGTAWAASRLSIQATVVVAEDASPAKVAALRRWPVELVIAGADYDAAEAAGRRLAATQNAVFVSGYNDPEVIAGQGTIAVEILEDWPEVGTVVVPVGGGGLVSGIGSWIKTVRPAVRIVGVQPETSPAMEHALRAGELVQLHTEPTLADGLAGNVEAGSVTFPLAQAVVDAMLLVSEQAIADAIRVVYHEMHLAIEGSAAVGIAALLAGNIGPNAAIIVTGRNIAENRLCTILG